ncbi:hypothetical protein HPB48_017776 [Haemaphysalis longicornis]|uniref:G-protein coupled receptors family 1 profile domain-containing protein n=1 Tax=Haemaphysalis longicornis TaxID=44386 RepID=A0A9J6GEX6_HAELO|nr:hypothetical protein HPB48_017776 [Haemaphysalis longicornis]
MLSVLVLEFFVCWTPLYVLHTWTVFDAQAAYSRVPSGAFAAVHLLSYVSSCCNPITYCFMHDKYRQAFRNVLGCSRASGHRRRRRWSSTKSHDRFVSLNSICSNGKNPSGTSLLPSLPLQLCQLRRKEASWLPKFQGIGCNVFPVLAMPRTLRLTLLRFPNASLVTHLKHIVSTACFYLFRPAELL